MRGKREKSAVCRWSVVVIMGIGITISVMRPVLAEDRNLSELIEALRDEDANMAAHAARLLGERGAEAEAAVPWLIEALVDDRRVPHRSNDFFVTSTVASHAAEALAEIGPAATAALVKVLDEVEDDEIRRLAIQAIHDMGHAGEPAAPALLKIMQEDNASHQVAAMRALLEVAHNPGRYADVFRERLKDPVPAIRVFALWSLADFGEAAHEAIPEIVRLLDDRESVQFRSHGELVAGSACRALGQLGTAPQPALEKIRCLMDDDDEYLRVDAALAWARLTDKDEPALEVLSASAQSKVRGYGPAYHAVSALEELGPQAQAALPVVKELLKHKDDLVRVGAVEAIAAIAPDQACELLMPLCDDPDSMVREYAEKHLTRCDGDKNP